MGTQAILGYLVVILVVTTVSVNVAQLHTTTLVASDSPARERAVGLVGRRWAWADPAHTQRPG